jgi:hypothetical protein
MQKSCGNRTAPVATNAEKQKFCHRRALADNAQTISLSMLPAVALSRVAQAACGRF